MSHPTLRPTNRLPGYPDHARLLIINADDFGMCHAANAAITRSLTAGLVTSTTLMVPCAWAIHAMPWAGPSSWQRMLSVAIQAEAATPSIESYGDA